MGYGQYTPVHTAGASRTKAEQVRAAKRAGILPDWSRKVGHNRTLIREDFGGHSVWSLVLHTTVVAEYDQFEGTLTLRDGGWPTMTTRRAMCQFRDYLAEHTGIELPVYYVWSGDKANHHLRIPGDSPPDREFDSWITVEVDVV